MLKLDQVLIMIHTITSYAWLLAVNKVKLISSASVNLSCFKSSHL